MQSNTQARPGTNGSSDNGQRMAQGLGWFSLGLGLAEVGAPGALAQLIGVPDDARVRGALRVFGAREIASGVAVLSRPWSAAGLWARVAGDAIDLAALGVALGWALGGRRTRTQRVVLALGAVAGVAALDVMTARRLQRAARSLRPATAIATVNRTPVQVYAAWRNFQEHPRFMDRLALVQALDERRSRWVAKAPAGAVVEWEAELVDDRPGERIAWRTLEGADVDHQGEVTFRPAPGGRGTEVRWSMRCGPQGGSLRSAIMDAFAAPQMRADLRRFKQLLETGALVHAEPMQLAARASDENGAVRP